jgi:hypothetical protein
LIVIKYALINKKNAAVKHFGLNIPMIRRWIKQSNDWKKKIKKETYWI